MTGRKKGLRHIYQAMYELVEAADLARLRLQDIEKTKGKGKDYELRKLSADIGAERYRAIITLDNIKTICAAHLKASPADHDLIDLFVQLCEGLRDEVRACERFATAEHLDNRLFGDLRVIEGDEKEPQA